MLQQVLSADRNYLPTSVSVIKMLLHTCIELLLVLCPIGIDKIQKVSLLSLSLAENLMSIGYIVRGAGVSKNNLDMVMWATHLISMQRFNYYFQMAYLTLERLMRVKLGIMHLLHSVHIL